MSDTLTNLLQAQHSSSVLQGIANPQLVNPLAAQNSAVAGAANIFNLRGLQAQDAWGNALQQATDANGNVDYARAQAIAARDPRARMGMMTGLQGASGLQTSQTSNINAQMSLRGRAGLSLAVDPSDANLKSVRDELISSGAPTAQVEANYQRMLQMSPEERQRVAHRLAAGSLEHFTGTPSIQGTGGEYLPLSLRGQQAPGFGPSVPTITQGGPGVGATLAPSDATTIVATYPATAEMVEAARKQGRTITLGQATPITKAELVGGIGLGGALSPQIRQQLLQSAPQPAARPPAVVVSPDGKPVSPANPARAPKQLVIPAQPATVAPVIPAPAPAGNPADPMAGIATVPAAPAPAVRRPASGPPTVPITGLAPDGSVQVASANPLEAPEVGAPSPPNPLVPGDVDAIQAGMQRARDNPRLPGTQTAGAGFTYGPGTEEQATAKLSAERFEAGLKAGTEYGRTMFPIAQALKQYGRGITTGPGAELANQWKGWIGGVSRSMGGPAVFDSSADFDKLAKDLNQVLMSNAGAGRSDASLAQTLAGNANTHVHEMAGEDVMKANGALVRANALAARQWQTMLPEDKAKYGHYFANFENDFNKTFDLRAGAYDMYNPAQAKTLLEDLRKGGKAYQDRFWNSVDMLERNGYLGDTRAMP